MWRVLLLLITSLAAIAVQAHHSNAEYDRANVTELEGVIARVIWRNPHVGLEVDVSEADGSTTRWVMGAADLASTLRRGVPANTFQVGQAVKFAGFASTRRPANMLVTNVQLLDRSDGLEVLLTRFAGPRWSDNVIGGGDWAAAAEVGQENTNANIFRVWTLDGTRRPAFADNPPLTASARAGFEAYTNTDDPALQCAPLGMPRVITQTGPHPIAFARQGENILLLGEYFDVRRVIHMGETVIPDSAPLSPLGYSIGRWEEDVLVIETARVNYPYFDIAGLAGIPQSEAAVFEERFYLSADGTALHMDFKVTDPLTFTETLAVEDYATWLWRPDIDILPYQCEVD